MNVAAHREDDKSEQGLVGAALELRGELSACSGEIDEFRQLRQDLANRMAALSKVSEGLATANGSAEWYVFIGTTFPSLLEKILADPCVIASEVFADSGTAVSHTRDGKPGYLINGHWRWGSGCHTAAWISGAIHEVDAAGQPVERGAPLTRVFFEPHQIETLDN